MYFLRYLYLCDSKNIFVVWSRLDQVVPRNIKNRKYKNMKNFRDFCFLFTIKNFSFFYLAGPRLGQAAPFPTANFYDVHYVVCTWSCPEVH